VACRQGFFLTIGNGGGVELRLNGESLGVPGKTGKVVRVKVPQSAKLLRVPKPSQEIEAEPEPQAVEGGTEEAVTPVQVEPEAEMEDDGFDL